MHQSVPNNETIGKDKPVEPSPVVSFLLDAAGAQVVDDDVVEFFCAFHL